MILLLYWGTHGTIKLVSMEAPTVGHANFAKLSRPEPAADQGRATSLDREPHVTNSALGGWVW